MQRRLGLAFLAGGTVLWLLACFYVRFRFIQADAWVAPCAADPSLLVCRFRETMGQAVHFRIPGYLGLGLALAAILVPPGRALLPTLLALWTALAALVFFNADLGALAAVLAVVRLAGLPATVAVPVRTEPKP